MTATPPSATPTSSDAPKGSGPAASQVAAPVAVVLARLGRLFPRGIDLSLARVERLLARLGDPHRRLPPVVHVAGTNGKGSTIAFLRAILEAAGQRVHVYTSPHLVRFNERIRLAGRLIDDDRLLEVLAIVEQANRDEPITFFEITTAAALVAFAAEPADVALIETGLGGRLDATNAIERPAVTAITRISYDHREYLGTTLAEIAAEKAGILKRGVPAVLAPQPEEAVAATLLDRAALVGARVHPWRISPRAGGFRFESPGRVASLPQPGLLGAHQIINAGIAIACLDHLPEVPNLAVMRGLRTVEWPGRLQRLSRGPLVERLPPGWELWLDGGHNDSAGEVLGQQAAVWSASRPHLPLSLVFGMLTTKEPLEFLAPLVSHVFHLAAVSVPGEVPSLSAVQAAAAALEVGILQAEPAATLAGAVDALVTGADRPGRILICGSLALAGAVLRENG